MKPQPMRESELITLDVQRSLTKNRLQCKCKLDIIKTFVFLVFICSLAKFFNFILLLIQINHSFLLINFHNWSKLNKNPGVNLFWVMKTTKQPQLTCLARLLSFCYIISLYHYYSIILSLNSAKLELELGLILALQQYKLS